MTAKCFYCKKETEVDRDFLNPNTNEIHPICVECKARILTYRNELMFFGKLLFFGVPLLFLLSIICFIFVSWQKGVTFLVATVLVGVISYYAHTYYSVKRVKKLGTYVDVKKIQWCKTCKHFLKTRNWNRTTNPLRQSKELVGDSEIPCKIVEDTKPVWTLYFDTDTMQRTLYPDNCQRWTRR